MALTTDELEQICGIASMRGATRRRSWVPVTLEFLGAENYVLGTKRTELSFESRSGGFGLSFRENVSFRADELLGKKKVPGVLMDVRLRFDELESLELRLADLTAGMYPRVLRTGEVVTL